jgi:hypothetical protein
MNIFFIETKFFKADFVLTISIDAYPPDFTINLWNGPVLYDIEISIINL